ncbi:MAG: hypothetical protein QM784_10910 [Polyangiaceae bacterium]
MTAMQTQCRMSPRATLIMVIGALFVTAAQWVGAVPLDGPPAGEAPGATRTPHPEPRVIVNVLSLRGPHRADRVQHDARFGWSRIVRCYKKETGAKERIVLSLELDISAEGSVTFGRPLRVDPKNSGLATCLGNTLVGLAMPKAPSSSTAEVEFVLSPGDRPQGK